MKLNEKSKLCNKLMYRKLVLNILLIMFYFILGYIWHHFFKIETFLPQSGDILCDNYLSSSAMFLGEFIVIFQWYPFVAVYLSGT